MQFDYSVIKTLVFEFRVGLTLWRKSIKVVLVFSPLSVSNTRFIAAVIERHTHTPERRRRYWGRSGTESDHGKTSTFIKHVTLIHRIKVHPPERISESVSRHNVSQMEQMESKSDWIVFEMQPMLQVKLITIIFKGPLSNIYTDVLTENGININMYVCS